MEDQTLEFEILEKKIDQILELINRLETENHELNLRNKELQILVDEKQKTIENFSEESEVYQKMKNKIVTYKKNHDRIKLKVESLIDKLKNFEEIQ
jgi:DNA-binding transcriptional regulator GbsR (MarR family)